MLNHPNFVSYGSFILITLLVWCRAVISKELYTFIVLATQQLNQYSLMRKYVKFDLAGC